MPTEPGFAELMGDSGVEGGVLWTSDMQAGTQLQKGGNLNNCAYWDVNGADFTVYNVGSLAIAALWMDKVDCYRFLSNSCIWILL